jgi:hypothetical protein
MSKLWFLLVVSFAVAACGGRQRAPEGGEEILFGSESLMGMLEDRALNYLLDLTFLIENSADEPQTAVDRVEAMLAVNGEEMLENAEAIEARFDALEGTERRAYEAQIAAHLDEAVQGWLVALQQFRNEHDQEGRAIWRLVEGLDE